MIAATRILLQKAAGINIYSSIATVQLRVINYLKKNEVEFSHFVLIFFKFLVKEKLREGSCFLAVALTNKYF